MKSMENFEQTAEILIVGAGMAGLTAAIDLQNAGRRVLVLDKGRGVGGRLASRRIGLATFDHGAQFMTARDPRFAALVEHWLGLGVAAEWFRGAGKEAGGHPRWRGKPAMTAVAKSLASNLHLLLDKKVVSLRRDRQGWIAYLESGEQIYAGAVLLTAPVPQSLALLDLEELSLPSSTRMRLESIEYERCLTVMAVLDEPSRIPFPGNLAPSDGPIAWIADNQAKGISSIPAVTIHATPAFSLEWWDRDRQESGGELLRAAQLWLGSDVTDFQVHGWRYSKPVRVDESPCLILSQSPALVLAGDAFGGARVEGAALSGWSAADTLKKILNQKT